jgi:hypothetical protein
VTTPVVPPSAGPEVPRIAESTASGDLPGGATTVAPVPENRTETRDLPPVPTPASMPLVEPATTMPASLVSASTRLEAPTVAAKVEAAAVDPSREQEALVRTVLTRYASAYSALDADAAQRVWPGVNRAALARAFESLASQRVSLGECRIHVAAASAQAQCAGSATWSPKVGSSASRTEARNWTFELARAGAAWQIVSARVQNR